ncbi:(d)CMP kinase [Reichenbachiella sp. MALMAid0571]|uniref:(d)CMP kinase n=1 Tax=Reichenbachiella sp. MALMAid0571 TaxID=3143939 RepID=UPI0032DFB6CF
MKKIIIAIDGYSACGKSTTAKVVATLLNYAYIDSGAMYRAVTLYFLDHYVDITNPKSVAKALANINIQFHLNPKNKENETFLNGLNVEKDIREMRVAEKVSEVSAIKDVRVAMVAQQQKLGKSKGVVMDGRDIGTVVFPSAELKIFMTADFDIRAERRQKELLEKGELIELDVVKENLAKRDQIDTSRKESPLLKDKEAVEIDTTHVTFDEQVEQIIHLAQNAMITT